MKSENIVCGLIIGIMVILFIIVFLFNTTGKYFNESHFKSGKKVSFEHMNIFYNAVFTPDTVKTFTEFGE